MNTFSRAEYLTLMRHDFMSFVELTFRELNPETRFMPAGYIEAIAAKLDAVRLGQIKRLIINLPPRSLKSHAASIAFPAWLLGHDPAAKIICVSYGQDLAERFSRDTRRLMQSVAYQELFATQLADRKAAYDFHTTRHGSRYATSVGGALTGLGADILIIDDPLKPDEALSEAGRNGVNEWFDNTLISRLNDKVNGAIVIVTQRLHQDDLVGHVLESGGEWEVLSFPAIAREDEEFVIETSFGRRSFRRKAGEALHPEREPLAALEMLRKTLGEYNFESQYQQDPQPPGGNMIRTAWLQYYDERPKAFSSVLQSWDTAVKATDLADFSVCTTWGVLNGKFYLLDVFRKRMNYPELKRAVVDQAALHRPYTVLIENKSSGAQLIQELQGVAQAGIKAYDPEPGYDKLMRLHAQTARFENGLVLLPRQAPWLAEYVRELTGFPGGKYDDQVDSTAQALHYLRGGDVLEKFMRAYSPWLLPR
jgi:predicted phage terminase large subunit-like protein